MRFVDGVEAAALDVVCDCTSIVCGLFGSIMVRGADGVSIPGG